MNKVRYFTADYCGPCKQMKPLAEELGKKYGVPIEYVDAGDEKGGAALAVQSGVRSLPTLHFISDTVVATLVGARTKMDLESMFRETFGYRN